MKYIKQKYIDSFFELINNSGISYYLIKNMGQELPDKLPDGKDIDIVVSEKKRQSFHTLMEEADFIQVKAPDGKEYGWNFLYQAPEYEFWKKARVSQNLYIHVYFCLLIKSLKPKCWIPLDKKLQKAGWQNRVFDEENKWWILGEEEGFVYRIARCILDKHKFSDVYQKEIREGIALLERDSVQQKLQLIFFKYTDRLCELLKEEKYSQVLQEYVRYIDY